MSKSRRITERTIKILYSKSAGRCNICEIELFQPKIDEDGYTHTGQMAHQHAHSSKESAPRFIDQNYSGDNSYDNLILLCANDHLIVDSDTKFYTIEKLKEIKEGFERKIANLLVTSESTDSQMMEVIRKFINFQSLYSQLNDPHLIPFDIDDIGIVNGILHSNAPTFYPFQDNQLTNLFEDIVESFTPIHEYLCHYYQLNGDYLKPYPYAKNLKSLTSEQLQEIYELLSALRLTIYNWLEYTNKNY